MKLWNLKKNYQTEGGRKLLLAPFKLFKIKKKNKIKKEFTEEKNLEDWNGDTS